MYKKFHLKLTIFSTFFTGLILVASTLLSLSLSEKEMEKNYYISFLNDLSAMLTYMENQTVISHQWLSKMEAGSQFLIQIYDKGKPLFYQTFTRTEEENERITRAAVMAKTQYNLDVQASSLTKVISKHEEFTIEIKEKTYYASVAIIPKSKGHLSAVILLSIDGLYREIEKQRVLFITADALAVIALFLFSYFFTGRMIQPLEENRIKQTQFIAAASHELRTPLAVILSSLSALQKAQGADYKCFIQMIHSEGNRMSRLIDDMLFLTSSESKSWRLAVETAEPDTLLLDVYEKYEELANNKQIRLCITLPEEIMPSCICDAQRITQVLSILLDNAIHYTPENGKIDLSLNLSGKYVQFCISDNGIGVLDTEKKKIFERFYRSETSHTDKEHFGLGLCVAKEIIKAHKGKIWVADNQPTGAKFYFNLPILHQENL